MPSVEGGRSLTPGAGAGRRGGVLVGSWPWYVAVGLSGGSPVTGGTVTGERSQVDDAPPPQNVGARRKRVARSMPSSRVTPPSKTRIRRDCGAPSSPPPTSPSWRPVVAVVSPTAATAAASGGRSWMEWSTAAMAPGVAPLPPHAITVAWSSCDPVVLALSLPPFVLDGSWSSESGEASLDVGSSVTSSKHVHF